MVPSILPSMFQPISMLASEHFPIIIHFDEIGFMFFLRLRVDFCIFQYHPVLTLQGNLNHIWIWTIYGLQTMDQIQNKNSGYVWLTIWVGGEAIAVNKYSGDPFCAQSLFVCLLLEKNRLFFQNKEKKLGNWKSNSVSFISCSFPHKNNFEFSNPLILPTHHM